jgi:peptide/nickel transport system permease protein
MLMRYIARRIILLVPVLLGISIFISALIRFAPGDPVHAALGEDWDPQVAEEMRKELGLDKPFVEWYLVWLGKVLRGDLGRSIVAGETVQDLIARRLPYTLVLSSTSMCLALMIAIPLGVISAVHKNTAIDNTSRVVSMIGVSMPVFWVGILLLIVFAYKFPVLPVGGSFERYGPKALILPSIALGTGFAALITRMTRSTMVEALLEEYITTAHAKGLPPNVVYIRHAFRNALIPIVTIVGFQLGIILGGTVLTETIFEIPGMGRLLVEAVERRDYPLIQGITLVTSLMFILANLIVDILYAIIDPRVSYE